MSSADVVTGQPVKVPTRADLEGWLGAQSLPRDAEHPIWQPSGGRRVAIRSREHLTVLVSALLLRRQPFGAVEWPRPFPQPWAQTRPAGDGFIVELNDGVVLPGREYPCTRRAFRGNYGDYPLPNESDPRYKTSAYPTESSAIFSSMEAADLIWAWINTMTLPTGVSVTMRHFDARERKQFGCGDE